MKYKEKQTGSCLKLVVLGILVSDLVMLGILVSDLAMIGILVSDDFE